jgi:OTU domain-containing protein 6
MEDLEAKHKKALKALDGEKRAAIKKAKGTKGKKAKDILAEVEEDYATKLKELEAAYQVAVQEAAATATTTGGGGGGGGGGAGAGGTDESASGPDPAAEGAPPVVTATKDDEEQEDNDDNVEEDAGLSAKERKQAKARRKKERQREKDLQRQLDLELEVANAGPSARHIETQQLMAILEPLNLKVSEVAADGHCLYRAVGAQTNQSFEELREYFLCFLCP